MYQVFTPQPTSRQAGVDRLRSPPTLPTLDVIAHLFGSVLRCVQTAISIAGRSTEEE
jgi:hypothetical protein